MCDIETFKHNSFLEFILVLVPSPSRPPVLNLAVLPQLSQRLGNGTSGYADPFAYLSWSEPFIPVDLQEMVDFLLSHNGYYGVVLLKPIGNFKGFASYWWPRRFIQTQDYRNEKYTCKMKGFIESTPKYNDPHKFVVVLKQVAVRDGCELISAVFVII